MTPTSPTKLAWKNGHSQENCTATIKGRQTQAAKRGRQAYIKGSTGQAVPLATSDPARGQARGAEPCAHPAHRGPLRLRFGLRKGMVPAKEGTHCSEVEIPIKAAFKLRHTNASWRVPPLALVALILPQRQSARRKGWLRKGMVPAKGLNEVLPKGHKPKGLVPLNQNLT